MKRKTINLNTYEKTSNPVRNLRDNILLCLGDSIFDIITFQDFAYESMKCFYPINRQLKNNVESIENACNKFFKIFPIKKGKLAILSSDGTFKDVETKEENLTPLQTFLFTYLQFETSPGITLRYLQTVVKRDMSELNELIKWYESQSYIKEYQLTHSHPRNHEERVLLDFYFRCIRELNIVTDYYLNGLKKRAISKANYWGKLKDFNRFAERFRDRPYHFARLFSLPYFDCRKIDLIANKTYNFSYDSSEKFQKLYETNKSKFYKFLFKRNSPQQLMQELKYHLSQLPLHNNRHEIFEELEKLFKKKSWIGYYALALSQIEGLFTEMYALLNSGVTSNKKSLPDKVKFVRPYHDSSDIYFDYYQYHIPRLRNRFMHSGFDEDFKLKSYDLLFDLVYLVRIFYELKNPLVKIKQLFYRRKTEDFINYEDFATYFELLNGLTKKQQAEIHREVRSFEISFLIPYCNAEFICAEVFEDFPGLIESFLEEVNSKILSKKKSIDLNTKNFDQLKHSLESDPKLIEIISDHFLYNRNQNEDLMAYNIFITNCRKHMVALNKDYLLLVDELNKKYGAGLRNITEINRLIQNL